MAALLRNRITAVWFVLIFATLVSWWLGTDHGLGSNDSHTAAALVIFAVAFIKIRYVGLYFMELRHAPVPLLLLFQGWVVVVFGVVVGLYLSGT